MIDGKSLTMLTDFYEFTMAGGFWNSSARNTVGYYDMYFRTVPDGGGYVIACGLESMIEYLSHLHFTDEDIEYLRSKKIFAEDFLDYLKDFRFCCDVWAVPEGTPMFPGEPFVTVRGPVIQAQLLETMILICMNHQTRPCRKRPTRHGVRCKACAGICGGNTRRKSRIYCRM